MRLNCSPTPTQRKGSKMYNFTITQGKKTILQFTDKTAIKAHAIVTTANELAKYKSQHLSYTYQYAK
jgi:hypothetical protein